MSPTIHFTNATGSFTYEEGFTPPTEPPPEQASGPTGGLITEWDATTMQDFKIDGIRTTNHTAAQPYALKNPDKYTVRYEMHPGDHASWYDNASVDRCENQRDKHYKQDSVIKIAFRIMLEAGPANSAAWFVLGEWHNDDSQLPNGWYTSPPIVLELVNEKFRVIGRYCRVGGNPGNTPGSDLKNMTLWDQPANLKRGQWYVFEMEHKHNQTNGYIKVKFDGAEVVNYTGPLGYGCDIYWMQGMYRDAASGKGVNMACQIKNLTIEPL